MNIRAALLAGLAAQLNTIVFVVGLAILYAGVASWSIGGANAVLGTMLMMIALWPHLRSRREGEPTR